MAVPSGASNRQVTLTCAEGRCRPCRQGAMGKAQAPRRGLGRPSPQVRPDISDFDAALGFEGLGGMPMTPPPPHLSASRTPH
jgi:hypothetical protein